MTAVISAGTEGDTGSAVAGAGGVTVLASGQFGQSTVEILVDADGLRQAPVHTFFSPGGIKLEAAAGSTVTANIVSGLGSSIDVSIV